MKAMILAAGGGTRLHPLTFALPKPMAPVANVPVMEHIIELLARHGFNELMVNLFYLPHFIEDHCGDGSQWGVRITYSREKELLGTAGGVKRVASFFDETFMVIGGDDLTDFDLQRAVAFHKEKGALASIGLYQVEDPSLYGVVVTEPDGRIRQFQEKPPRSEALSNWINTGVYIFEPAIFDHIPEGEFFDFGKQLFPYLVEKGLPFYGCPLDGYWCDVGDLQQYRQAHEDVMLRKAQVRVPGQQVHEGIWLQEGAFVADDATLVPPVLLGPGCRVGAGARLEGMVVLGADCVVAPGAELKNVVLWDGCVVGEGARASSALLGARCSLGTGAVLHGTALAAETRVEGTVRNVEFAKQP